METEAKSRDEHIKYIDEVNARVWNVRGSIPTDDFDPVKEGLAAYNKSVELDYKYGQGRALINMGMRSFILMHNSTLAFQQFDEAIEILKELNEKKWVANAHLSVAIVGTSTGKLEKALFHALRGLDYYENNQNDDYEGQTMCYYCTGTVYKDLKKFAECEKYYRKGIAVPEAENNMWGGRILAGLSNVLMEQEKYEEAIEMSVRSLKILDEVTNPIGHSRALNDIGIIYKRKKEYKNALDYLFKSLKLRESVELRQFVLPSLTEIAAVYYETGESELAIDYLKRAAASAIEINQPSKLAKIYQEIGIIYKYTKQFELALEYTEKFLEITSSIQAEERNKKIENLQSSLLEEKEQEIERLRNVELKHAYEIISEKNKEILDSINYAKRIQTAILPPQKSVQKLIPDSFILYKPKDIVAGDFYWLEEKDDRILFAACDCTGHGVPGALVSVICNNGLNRSVREHNLTDPGKILDKTQEIIVAEFEKSDDEVKDGMDISLCSLSLSKHALEWAGANNPLWLIRKSSGELEEIKANKQPIGKFANSKPFVTHKTGVEKGDLIYVFTDGYQDQFGGDKGKKFRAFELKELLLKISDKKMSEQKQILDETFEKWKGNLEQIDDVCIVGVMIH